MKDKETNFRHQRDYEANFFFDRNGMLGCKKHSLCLVKPFEPMCFRKNWRFRLKCANYFFKLQGWERTSNVENSIYDTIEVFYSSTATKPFFLLYIDIALTKSSIRCLLVITGTFTYWAYCGWREVALLLWIVFSSQWIPFSILMVCVCIMVLIPLLRWFFSLHLRWQLLRHTRGFILGFGVPCEKECHKYSDRRDASSFQRSRKHVLWENGDNVGRFQQVFWTIQCTGRKRSTTAFASVVVQSVLFVPVDLAVFYTVSIYKA